MGATGGQMFAAGLPPLEEAAVRKKRLEAVSKQLKDAEKGAGERVKLKLIAEKGKDLVRWYYPFRSSSSPYGLF